MITKKLEDAINAQINKELFSAYLYLSMAAYFESIGLAGFGSFMRVQTQEEHAHAMKFYDYLLERQGKIHLQTINAPPTKFSSPIEVFEITYEHEKYVSGLINDLMTLAIEEKDYAAQSFLNWFIDEQVEEESTADNILSKLKLIKGEGQGIYLLDQEMSKRVFTPIA